MDVDRFEGVRSAVAERTELAAAPVAPAAPPDGAGGVVGIAGGSETTLIAAALGAVVLFAVAGALVAYRRREGGPPDEPSGPGRGSASSGAAGGDAAADATADGTTGPNAGDASAAFDERIGERTLDRLEPVVPDAVGRVRDRLPLGRTEAPNAVDGIERELEQAVEDALDDGRFDPSVTSPLGGSYEVVNLPGEFRELTVPPEGETVHVSELEGTVRDALADRGLHDAARTVAAVHEHCRDVESHVRRREESYLDERRAVEGTLEDVRDVTDRFDGPLADRVREFVVDGRHDALPGVRDVERRLDAADRSLHACAFDDADRTVRAAGRSGDELLTAVDFLGGVTGTIDHGNGRVAVPDGVAEAFVADLVPVLERQYAVAVALEGDELVVANGGASRSADGDPSRPGERASGSGRGESDHASSGGSAGASDRGEGGGREQFSPDAVADEILFVFRELDGRGGSGAVECQTERLPDAVARREVLEPLATFCRRQTDLVESVTLQENAPPGFFEIEFRDGTTAAAGIDALRERFTERHGG